MDSIVESMTEYANLSAAFTRYRSCRDLELGDSMHIEYNRITRRGQTQGAVHDAWFTLTSTHASAPVPPMAADRGGFVSARPDGDKNLQKYRKLVQSGTRRSALVYFLESQLQQRGGDQPKRCFRRRSALCSTAYPFCRAHCRCYMKSIASGLFQSAMIFTLALAVTACALLEPRPPQPYVTVSQTIAAFSSVRPGDTFPRGWKAAGVPKFRKLTRYELVEDTGTTVVHAVADSSSSGLAYDVKIDPDKSSVVRWRWKVPHVIPGEDNTKRDLEDSAARVVFAFSGKTSALPFSDRLFFAQVKALAGIDVPYATLEYIWGDGAPVGTIIANSWTSRIRMLVVESGAQRTGQWITERRNLYDDFKQAFGEEPGKLTHVGISTDADATGSTAEAYYGDIELSRAERPS